MDSDQFDRLAKTLSTSGSRRGTLGALLGGALGLLGSTPAAARRKKGRGSGVTRERCLTIGEKCPKTLKHGKKKKLHTCENNCCTRFSQPAEAGKRRCACIPEGEACTQATARNCCSQRCGTTGAFTNRCVPYGR